MLLLCGCYWNWAKHKMMMQPDMKVKVKSYLYGTAQRQLDTHTREAGSAPEGDISTGMRVPVGIFPVSSKACL